MSDFATNLNPEGLPFQSWDVNMELPPEAQQVNGYFESLPYDLWADDLRSRAVIDTTTGIQVAHLGDPSSSVEEAIVHINPYANGLSDHMLMRAEHIRKVARLAGVHDAEGKSLPVLTMALPSRASKLKLSHQDWDDVRHGEFSSIASEYLNIARWKNFGKVALVGVSAAAPIVVSGAGIARESNLDVRHVFAGAPPTVIGRGLPQLFLPFMGEAKHLAPDIEATGSSALREAHDQHSMTKATLDMLARPKANWNIFKGLTKDTFPLALRQVASLGIGSTVAYGSLDPISPVSNTLRAIGHARVYGRDIHGIEVVDGHHTWADRTDLLSVAVAYSLTR